MVVEWMNIEVAVTLLLSLGGDGSGSGGGGGGGVGPCIVRAFYISRGEVCCLGIDTTPTPILPLLPCSH